MRLPAYTTLLTGRKFASPVGIEDDDTMGWDGILRRWGKKREKKTNSITQNGFLVVRGGGNVYA